MSIPAADDLARIVIQRAETLARIPAPTGAEQQRAEVVTGWWEADGLAPTVDAAGNVWAMAIAGDGPAILLCAHLDTVFGHDVPHAVSIRDGRMIGPGVGDDCVGVAALSQVGKLAADSGPAGQGGPLWLLATVGEEGAGNLAGIRHALAEPPQPVAAVIAVEGNYLGRVVNTGVGSVRWLVSFSGPGGHAWERSDVPSAVHAAAAAASQIAALTVAGAQHSVNIGTIGGGEAITARARSAWFTTDLRAASAEILAALERQARKALEAITPAGISVEVTEIGRRPAGQTEPSSPLVRAAITALERAGETARLGAASTDANAAYAAGILAIALGVTRGAGEHTPGEWIETAPIGSGVAVLAETIMLFWKAAA
ncbi:MAG TPA: M20/M25/M40 family metallo-hydrolase [Streptosporangiaceae bacterium]|nr:M20/M25/M40 family metallo-hydrolase [Streptosporangiaceae bacterium]